MFSQVSVFLSVHIGGGVYLSLRSQVSSPASGPFGEGVPSLWFQVLSGGRGSPASDPRSFPGYPSWGLPPPPGQGNCGTLPSRTDVLHPHLGLGYPIPVWDWGTPPGTGVSPAWDWDTPSHMGIGYPVGLGYQPPAWDLSHGQVALRSVRLLRFHAGGLSCFSVFSFHNQLTVLNFDVNTSIFMNACDTKTSQNKSFLRFVIHECSQMIMIL